MSDNDPEEKRYRIGSLLDFLDVPVDRLDTCLADFRDYLDLMRPIVNLVDEAKLVAEAEGQPVDEDATYGPFIWIDDGKPSSCMRPVIEIQESADGGLEIMIRSQK